MHRFLKFKKVPEEIKQTIVQMLVDQATGSASENSETKPTPTTTIFGTSSFKSKACLHNSLPQTPAEAIHSSLQQRRWSV